MGALFIYILKSSVCLVLFYLFFRLLLSKETFHRFNRIALLGVLFLSLVIPWVEVTTTHQVEVQQTMLTLEQLLMMAEMETTSVEVGGVEPEVAEIPWVQILLLLYLVGILVFTCRNLYSLTCLLKLIRSGKRERMEEGITLVVHEQEVAPFSWMKYIVISRKDLEENGREILIHETAHIRNRHSIDLLIADICIFFQWFNPGAWLLKQELQNIHEYEADETVINKGVNAKEYQLLLIKKAVGTRLYSMANSFNHSKLKKRITMMLKEKSNPWARLKYLYVLPLAAVAVTAFARPEISEKAEEISVVKVNDLANFVQEKVLQDTVKVSKIEKSTGLEVVGAKAKGEEAKKIIFEVVEQMPEYPGGTDALRKYLEDKVAGSEMKGKAGGRVLVEFTVAQTGKVENVQVLQSDQSVLNEEAERIVREMPNWTPGKQRGRPVPVKYSVPVMFGKIRFAENKQPLILANGKEISVEEMGSLNPEVIESVSVLKDSASIGTYGKRGANGVILVSVKRTDTTHAYGKEMKVSTINSNSTPQTDAVPDFPVTGTIIDEQGRPKAGVSVIIPRTTHGTLTDIDGHFKLKAVKGGNLWFSFIGYKPVKVAATSKMMVRMEPEIVRLLPELTGTLKNTSSNSGIGMPNGITVHGIKKGAQPLVIIDGKEAVDKDALSKISPDRIESLSILKDETAEYIHGEKGKDGVILVTLLTDEEYELKKNHTQKPYENAWEMVDKGLIGSSEKVTLLVDGKKTALEKLKTISAKAVHGITSFDDANRGKVIDVTTEKYYSEWIPVAGIVKDTDGAPIRKVGVVIKGTNWLKVTNAEGRFSLKAPKGAELQIMSPEIVTVTVKSTPEMVVIVKKK